jgi:hypothetical protein
VPIRRRSRPSSQNGGNVDEDVEEEDVGEKDVLEMEGEIVKFARKHDPCIDADSASDAIHQLTVSTDDCEMSENGDSLDRRIGTGGVTCSKCVNRDEADLPDDFDGCVAWR